MRIKLYRADKDHFWLECTVFEAENRIYPCLVNEEVIKSRFFIEQASRHWSFGNEDDNSEHPHDMYSKRTIKYPVCFSISRDFKTIIPFEVSYPYSPQWNAYCPFELIDELEVEELSELLQKILSFRFESSK